MHLAFDYDQEKDEAEVWFDCVLGRFFRERLVRFVRRRIDERVRRRHYNDRGEQFLKTISMLSNAMNKTSYFSGGVFVQYNNVHMSMDPNRIYPEWFLVHSMFVHYFQSRSSNGILLLNDDHLLTRTFLYRRSFLPTS